MSKIDELIQDLAMVRDGLSKAKAKLKEMKSRLETSRGWKMWYGLKAKLAQDEREIDGELRQYAIRFGKGNPHGAIEVQEWAVMHYSEAQAIEWCFHHDLRDALLLDVKLFEKHAKGVQKTAPIPFVTFGKKLKVKIDRDLSAYLPEE